MVFWGCLLLLIANYLLLVQASFFLAGSFLRSAVQAPTTRKRREFREEGLDFDAAGNLPKIEEVYKDLNDYASPICAIRFVNTEKEGKEGKREGILLAFGRSVNTSDAFVDSSVFQSVTDNLQKYSGLRNYLSLASGSWGGSSTSQKQSVLITGGVGDTRAVSRTISQISLNHTFDYDCAASGKYLAESLGRFVQQSTMGADNPLIAHVLIASTTPEHAISLHSVDAVGNVAEIMAGMAGRGMTRGLLLLEEHYRPNITLNEAKDLAELLINPPDTDVMHIIGSDMVYTSDNNSEKYIAEEEDTLTANRGVMYNVEFVVM